MDCVASYTAHVEMENLMNTTLNDASLSLGMRRRNNRCRFGTAATILLTALSALGIVSNASAESITKTFTGSVVAGQLVDNFSATRSDALGLFGTAGGSLVGDQAIVALTFDAGTASFVYCCNNGGDPEYYFSTVPTNVSITVTINGQTVSVADTNTTVGGNLREYYSLALNLNSVSGGLSLSSEFDNSGNPSIYGGTNVLTSGGIGPFSQGVTGIQLYYGHGASDYINIGNLTVAPEPSSIVLMFAPLALAAVARKRFKR